VEAGLEDLIQRLTDEEEKWPPHPLPSVSCVQGVLDCILQEEILSRKNYCLDWVSHDPWHYLHSRPNP